MNHNDNLVQEFVHASSNRAIAAARPLCERQKTAIMNTFYDVIRNKAFVLQADLQGIYNALEYACAFIKAGRKEMDEEARAQLLNAMEQISRYTTGEPESAADLTEESNDPRSHAPVTFKVDDVPIRVGQDMRVEYEDKEEGRTLIVVLSHEGIIMDLWDANGTEPTATSSIMYNEKVEEMLDQH